MEITFLAHYDFHWYECRRFGRTSPEFFNDISGRDLPNAALRMFELFFLY